jgi:hypothetical protein
MATESLMMKQSDKETDAYATAGGGGALKLKGVEVYIFGSLANGIVTFYFILIFLLTCAFSVLIFR